ncbi:MAG TPA: putative inorganic carbon transporter subunit DabA, partial [Azonexus sp.]
MDETADLPLRERLAHWIEQLEYVLPAQAPIRDFVHHNTLHGFQHLPFAEALAAAQHLTGAATYWPEARFRASYAAGRITRDDLLAALDDFGLEAPEAEPLPGFSRRDIVLASLLAADDGGGPAHAAWCERERPAGGDPWLIAARMASAARPLAAAGDWREVATARWQTLCAEVGHQRTLRSLLEHLSGEDVLETVRGILQRHLAAHLDLGIAAWRNPQRGLGFFAAWRASAGLDLFWELDELPNVRDEILHLVDDPLAVLLEELPRLAPDARLWPGYLQRLSLELPGWSGMVLWRDRHPDCDDTPVAMLDYLTVRVLLERLLCEDLMARLTGGPTSFAELQVHYLANPAEFFVRDALRRAMLPETLLHRAAHYLAAGQAVSEVQWLELADAIAAAARPATGAAGRLAALARQLGLPAGQLAALTAAEVDGLLAAADALTPPQRGQVWLLAYERHYREELFAALAANRGRRHAPPVAPSAQVICCMDDREEGTRRHLEEIAPDIVTYGAAGFFGVAMYWQGVDDGRPTALCPIVVTPRHVVRERPAAGTEAALRRHAARRARRLRWRQ